MIGKHAYIVKCVFKDRADGVGRRTAGKYGTASSVLEAGSDVVEPTHPCPPYRIALLNRKVNTGVRRSVVDKLNAIKPYGSVRIWNY